MKTKLGISVTLFAAGVFLSGLLSNYTTLVIVVGYILLMESDDWLRKCAVKAAVITFGFGFAIEVVSLIPNALSTVSSLFSILDVFIDFSFITKITSFVISALGLLRSIVLVLLAFKSLNNQTMKIDKIDNMVDSNM